MRKNPENKPLRINVTWRLNTGALPPTTIDENGYWRNYGLMLSNLAVAQSNLVKAGQGSAMPHFIAIVKELERLYGFEFRTIEDAT